MTTIKFPNDSIDYFRLGSNFYNEENYEQAIYYLKEAYITDKCLKTHQLIVESYQGLGEYKEALSIFLEKQEDYLLNFDGQLLYYNLLCQNHEWFQAHVLIATYDELLFKQEELKGLEKSDLIYRKSEIKNLEEQLANDNNLNNVGLWKKAKTLPLDNYLKLIKSNLINPNLSLVIRSDLFTSLCQLKFDDDIKYLNYNYEILILNPSKMILLQNDDLYDQIINIIHEQLKDNPVMVQKVTEYTLFILSCLFPDTKHLLNNELEQFVKEVYNQLNFVSTSENLKFKSLIDKINIEFIKLT